MAIRRGVRKDEESEDEVGASRTKDDLLAALAAGNAVVEGGAKSQIAASPSGNAIEVREVGLRRGRVLDNSHCASFLLSFLLSSFLFSCSPSYTAWCGSTGREGSCHTSLRAHQRQSSGWAKTRKKQTIPLPTEPDFDSTSMDLLTIVAVRRLAHQHTHDAM